MIEVKLMIPDEAVRALKELAFLKEMSEAQVLNNAIDYYRLVTQEQLSGGKILIERGDGTFRLITES